MNYIKITKNDVANGEGVRVVLWLSGCSHHCNGCHNPQTWNANDGVKFDDNSERELFDALNKPHISGLTLSGGDPLNEANLSDVLKLIDKIRLLLPNKTIWIYTGYTWKQIFFPIVSDDFNPERDVMLQKRKDIISSCDVLVDGRYIESLKNITLKFRGSENQEIIDIKKSLEEKRIIPYEV